MAWTFDQVAKKWPEREILRFVADQVVSAFDAAEEGRGRAWVDGAVFDEIFSFGKYMQFVGPLLRTLGNAPGVEELRERVLRGDRAAASELEAIHLLRMRRPRTEVEVAPAVKVGDHERHPDFRIREGNAPWVYVEVTRLGESEASAATREAMNRLSCHLTRVQRAFMVEVILWRELKDGEEDVLTQAVYEVCHADPGHKRDVGDVASLIAKSGDPAIVIPSILPEDDNSRMSVAVSIGGADTAPRQIMIRAPFADERAEAVLRTKAKQLPKDESGLLMVNVARQPTAFDSWSDMLPSCFSASQRTRVGGVLLFMVAETGTIEGPMLLPLLKLVPNPHARLPIPAWISDVVADTRADAKRLMGRPD